MRIFNQPLAHEGTESDSSADGDDNDVTASPSKPVQPTPKQRQRRPLAENTIVRSEPRPKQSGFSVYCDENAENIPPMSQLTNSARPAMGRQNNMFGNYLDSEPEDITRQLDLMREQGSHNHTACSFPPDDDFTIDLASREGICSTPYTKYIPSNVDKAEEGEEEDTGDFTAMVNQTRQAIRQYSTARQENMDRPRAAMMPMLTPIAEVSERSMFYLNSSRSGSQRK
jgi:hypothetical protein